MSSTRKLQSHRSTSVGKIKRWQKENAGISGETEKEKFKILFYSENTVRITLTPAYEFEDLSYAAVADALDISPAIKENGTSMVFQTSTFSVELLEEPFGVVYKVLEGDIVNEDDHAFGACWSGEQVTTERKLQE